MSNPFLSTGTSNSSSNVKVNNKSPNFNGNIQLSISDIPNLQTTLNNLTQGVSAQQLSQLTDVSISNPLNNQSILYDSSTQKYKNKSIDHVVNVSNAGVNSHSQIDSHIGASTGVHGVTGVVV